jgi:hypothetical protein
MWVNYICTRIYFCQMRILHRVSAHLTDRVSRHKYTNIGILNLYIYLFIYLFILHGSTAPSGPGPPHYRGFAITLKHATLGRTPPDEWSARCRDLYLTTHNTRKRQTSMLSAGFEPTISASDGPQTHALGRAATGIGIYLFIYLFIHSFIYLRFI